MSQYKVISPFERVDGAPARAPSHHGVGEVMELSDELAKEYAPFITKLEEVPVKVYEALQDFVLPKTKEDGTPDGEVSYAKGEKYELPEAVAKLAPEGALKEFVPPAAEKPAPVPAKPWAGNHTVNVPKPGRR